MPVSLWINYISYVMLVKTLKNRWQKVQPVCTQFLPSLLGIWCILAMPSDYYCAGKIRLSWLQGHCNITASRQNGQVCEKYKAFLLSCNFSLKTCQHTWGWWWWCWWCLCFILGSEPGDLWTWGFTSPLPRPPAPAEGAPCQCWGIGFKRGLLMALPHSNTYKW